jgi:hypothetical protein
VAAPIVRDECWVIENYRARECRRPWREFRSLVSLHNHSSYSVENLASLDRVMGLGFMAPLRGIVRRAFGLDGSVPPDYAEMRYNPPLTPRDIWELELHSARRLGFDDALVAITDHNEVRGGLELAAAVGGARIGVGEELSLRFQGHLFHLGVTGLAPDDALAVHERLRAAAAAGRLDDLLEQLDAARCLVVLNHPLLAWDGKSDASLPALGLLSRYGRFIHALEYNGMRRRAENDAVIELAQACGKPLVGGGDSHLLVPASALCASPSASRFAEFVEEVRAGQAVTLVKSSYSAPHGWKMFLRVLAFMARYREIATYRDVPASSFLSNRLVLLDPVGLISRAFLRLVSALELAR